MNRADRRAMTRALAKGIVGKAKPGPETVTLRGGPMDGWVVPPNAPALRENWFMTWPDNVAREWTPGRYVVTTTAPLKIASWQPDHAATA